MHTFLMSPISNSRLHLSTPDKPRTTTPGPQPSTRTTPWSLRIRTHLCCLEALPHVQVAAGLINHVHIRMLRRHNGNGKALQLAAAQVLHVAVQHLGAQVGSEGSAKEQVSVCELKTAQGQLSA